MREVQMNNVRNTPHALSIRVGNELFIVSKSENSTASWHAGWAIAGFGKGDWKSKPRVNGETAAHDPNKELLFRFDSADDKVVLAGEYKTLRDIIEEKRQTSPTPTICYHNIIDAPTPEDPGAFKLDRQQDIFFISAAPSDDSQLAQPAIAKTIPV